MKYLFVIFSLLSVITALAQQPATKQKAQNIYFYKNDYKEVFVKDSADFIKVVSEPDSGESLYNIHEYYKNGKPKLLGKSSNVHPIVLQDQCVSYYPNGKKKYVANYKYNTPLGKTYRYYPNGTLYIIMDLADKVSVAGQTAPCNDSVFVAVYDSLGHITLENGNGYYKSFNEDFKTVKEEGLVKNSSPAGTWKGYNEKYHLQYIEQYNDGKLTSGTSIDSAGISHGYNERSTVAKFPGGQNEFGKYLAKSLRYPYGAFKNRAQGRIICQFVIQPNRKASNLKVARPVDKDLDQEALRVLSAMPNWIPGTFRGVPIAEYFTVPIIFNAPR